ncbi:MAG: UDP-N-acetylmuramoyl-L-alanyl-D-glutamate--2,6-diaminopimelate ligase [Burkholderiaceae bacterium]
MSAPAQLDTPREAAAWLHARVRGALSTDSRAVGVGDGFIAWPGAATDGRRFVGDALAQGASAVLVEREGADAFSFDAPQVATYPGLKAATGLVAEAYYESPSRQLRVVAITGTNGKTSSAWWLAAALSRLERMALAPCGLVGTLGIGVPPHVEYNGLTTPDPVLLQRRLRGFVDDGVKACVMEASSIGLAEHRLAGTAIEVAVFTNFTQDHLDYHGGMAAYWDAKAALFDWSGLKAAVVNIDDPHGEALVERVAARGLPVWTVSQCGAAALRAERVQHGTDGLAFDVVEGSSSEHLVTALVGDYNISNLLGVLGALRALGVPLADAVAACAGLPAVPGRMERVGATQAGEPVVVVDYAHTPDALVQALAALRPLADARGGRLWCVFGCGGNRDAGKRPLMARAAQDRADAVVLTSDNPRWEDPAAILRDIESGFDGAQPARVDIDRARAIAWTVTHAAAADVVLLAGKGHEDYQEIAGERRPLADQALAAAALAARRDGREMAA